MTAQLTFEDVARAADRTTHEEEKEEGGTTRGSSSRRAPRGRKLQRRRSVGWLVALLNRAGGSPC